VILFLDSETITSQWVVHGTNHHYLSLIESKTLLRAELQTARRCKIPIIVVIDIDTAIQRELIDSCTEAGFAFLFEEQVIPSFW